MSARIRSSFNRRFSRSVLLPGAVILLVTAGLRGGALVWAGRGTDQMSVMGQQFELWRAVTTGMDELSLAQESVGLCAECIVEAGSAEPDATWLDQNVGFPLFDLHKVHETYILDSRSRPVYAAVQRRRAAPSAYERVAPAVDRFVKLARGAIERPNGRSNLNERLPGSSPAPIEFPPCRASRTSRSPCSRRCRPPKASSTQPTSCGSATASRSSAPCK